MKNKKRKCCVLIASYNGERYIFQQLESVFNQNTEVEVFVYIRDDGSTDKTKLVVKKYQEKYPHNKIEYCEGKNVGIHRSFLKLMEKAPDADYYALADQDDIWENTKISSAVKLLEKNEKMPSLYYSNYEVVDKNLNHICDSNISNENTITSVTQILFHNKVPGCTIVFNKELLKLINELEIKSVRMHDSYILLLAYLFGTVYCDSQKQIKYRQHDFNVLGYKSKKINFYNWLQQKVKQLKCVNDYDMAEMAQIIYSKHSNKCSTKQRKELKTIALYKTNSICRMKLFFSLKTISKTSFRSTMSVKINILLKKI